LTSTARAVLGVVLISLAFIWLFIALFLRVIAKSGLVTIFAPDPNDPMKEDHARGRFRQDRQAQWTWSLWPGALASLIAGTVLIATS
jgi:hypothetical protein